MPTKGYIAANKITEDMLVPHLRNKKRTSVFSYSLMTTSSEDGLIVCAESISIGQAIGVNCAGKAVVASSVATGYPAFAIALEQGIVDQAIKYTNSKFIEIPGATFTIGSYVFLKNGSPNLSTSPISFADNERYQILGIAKSTNILEVNIEEAKIVNL